MTAPAPPDPPPGPPRLGWADDLRVAAAFAVVLLHTAAGPLAWPGASAADWWAANLYDGASRWCVPAFVALTGGLLVGRAGAGSAVDFLRHRLPRLLAVTAFWTLFYYAYAAAFRGAPAGPGHFAGRVLTTGTYYHLWFLPMLCGVYCAVPVAGRMMRLAGSEDLNDPASRRVQWWVASGLLLVAVLHDVADRARGRGPADVFLVWAPYAAWLPAAHLLFTAAPPRRPAAWLAAAAACALAVPALAGGLWPALGPRAVGVAYSYFNPFTVLATVCLVRGLSGLTGPPGRARRAVRGLAPLTLGIYLIHPVWLDLARDAGLAASAAAGPGAWAAAVPAAVTVPAVAAGVFAASAGSAALLRRVPGVRRLVL